MEKVRMPLLEQFVNRATTAFVGAGNDIATGLVKNQRDGQGHPNLASMDPHIVVRANSCGEFIDSMTIDHNRAG
jgi:hypothetical protein